MHTDENGLSTTADVEALADQLTACADQLHARIMDEVAVIAAIPGATPERARRHAIAAALLDSEQELRQRANGLYADAATAVVGRLGKSQQHVIALTQSAAEKVRTINLLSDATGLVAGLLALAGGIASAQPAPVLAALEVIRVQVKAVKADLPRKPA